MHPLLDNIRTSASAAIDRGATRAARLQRHHLAWGGLALAAIAFLAVNLFSASALPGWKADLTRDSLYTMSPGTRKALSAIDEPIDVRVYFSKRLGEAAPVYAKYFERVRTLLEQYRSIAGNKLNVSYFDPEPFSDAEDRAVAAGLRGIRLNAEGELGYFGLAGANSTDNEGTIAFFAQERERFIEYDVTKLIYSLANPKKRVVGLLTTLPIDGGLDPVMGMRGQPKPPQMVMEQLRETFAVKTLARELDAVPADVDVLMIVQPDGLPPATVYAIDQFALKGGKVLLFVDPVAEMSRAANPMMMGAQALNLGDFDKLLRAWGVSFDATKVAGDIRHARRIQFGGGQRGPTVTDYVAWLRLDKRNLDQKDVLSGGVEHINVASAGFLGKVAEAKTTLAPILVTSREAMAIAADKVSAMPDAVALLRDYKPGGKSLNLAARVSGEAPSAYPDGAPRPPAKPDDKKPDATAPEARKAEDKAAAKPGADKKPDTAKSDAKPAGPAHIKSGRINAIVIADTDILSDLMWVEVREFLGQQVAVPNAQNAAFVLAALENLTGSDALISLRGRGITDRPFELVDTIRRNSERRFREKEQTLTTKLKGVQAELAKLEKVGEGENVLLSDKDRQTIEKFRAEMLTTRRELRDVKLALRRDIDRLDGWLQFANIGLVPLLIAGAGLGWTFWRRRRGSSPGSPS